jgi:glycine cleavage system aminomethyltransferase T
MVSSFAAYMPIDLLGIYHRRPAGPAVAGNKAAARNSVVGLSLFTAYSHNERKELSLGVIDPSIDVGTEVTLVWGEPDGGSLSRRYPPFHR